jgi:hypothetical protein
MQLPDEVVEVKFEPLDFRETSHYLLIDYYNLYNQKLLYSFVILKIDIIIYKVRLMLKNIHNMKMIHAGD